MIVTPALRHPVRRLGSRTIDFDRRIAVMAIVNRTPDSFFDQGATFALDSAVDAALRAAELGADWVDVGGAKFAPGPEIPAEEELDRVLPVVAAVAERSDVVISVDTFRASVAAACIAAGAHVVNDTTGLSDPEMAAVVAGSGASLVITHSLAAPRRPHPRPRYDDVVAEVRAFLDQRVEEATAAGVTEAQLFVDPGHDLNKNTRHSLELTRRFDEIAAIGLPALAAVSNKDFVGESLGAVKSERTEGSLVAATVCALLGARVVRMHDVAASVKAMRMLEAVLGFREPVQEVHNV
ncbi:dihydropteroate synthase [Herbiconiux sp. KACC 21604]|uniref:dihydropteroate synthase n=1 Tax=unclassified Herbiconiux TaxID=2618217 RepID=UPI001490E11D|nr:dihydropteroate synthase [Herbiconiux sp. SALV-R1]QJU53235.1 dihydropteroate synthase [Herbiconiux sp. SALV-R1]WPO88193.1 dihydropteroate synthase [Herbiconiux sp. KACC 21604]